MPKYNNEFGIDPKFLPTEALWMAIEPLLPEVCMGKRYNVKDSRQCAQR